MTGLSDRAREAQERCKGDVRFRQWVAFEGRAGFMLYVDTDTTNGYVAPAENVVANMRITPYTDSEGRDIYEADLVEWEEGRAYVAQGEWGEWWARFADCSLDWSFHDTHHLTKTDGKIVGNVYQNPELLEGE